MEQKLYELQDMVKVGCGGCMGCSSCCEGMGDTIIVDPYDAYRLTEGLNLSFEAMLQNGLLSLRVEEGVILPHLTMNEKNRCVFLNDAGRCSIHESRPGLCRIFPLGRQYKDGRIFYFLLDECKKSGKVKMKVEKWIDTKQTRVNEQFLLRWHDYIKQFRAYAKETIREEGGETVMKQKNMLLLQTFYFTPYRDDFYEEFEERLNYMQNL